MNKMSFTRIFSFLMLLVLVLGINTYVYADDQIPQNTLIKVIEDTSIKESPDNYSKSISEVSVGTTMFTIGEGSNGWYKVKLREIEGYIQENQVAIFGTDNELQEEFDMINNQDMKIVDLVNEIKNDRIENIIWIVTMSMLVIITTVVSIVMTTKKKNSSDVGEDE